MKGVVFRAGWFLPLLLLLASCAGYEAIPWHEAPGRAGAVQALGERLASGLADGVGKADIKLSRIRARQVRGKEEEEKVSRVVVAGFPEARTGVRTAFSRQVEEAVRRALGRSKQFRLVDGGEGVAWQEAKFPNPRQTAPAGRSGAPTRLFGDWRELKLSPELAEGELDGDHPLQGLWVKAKGGAYGEGSAVYAAAIFGADAAVFGAYALGPGRVRVWAAVVLNTAPRTIYYTRGLKDVFGLPERVEVGRIYPAYARDALPRAAVPDEALATRLEPRPRQAPVHPPFWGEPALEVVLEEIDSRGQRKRLAESNLIGVRSLIVGRLAARTPRHVYAFALNGEGEAEEIFSSADPQRPGWARRVEAGRFLPFAARLIEPDRMYRIFFVSSPGPFMGERAIREARRRLGLGKESGPARSARDAAQGAPSGPWFVPGGQDRLVLAQGWDQQVFWLFRQGSR